MLVASSCAWCIHQYYGDAPSTIYGCAPRTNINSQLEAHHEKYCFCSSSRYSIVVFTSVNDGRAQMGIWMVNYTLLVYGWCCEQTVRYIQRKKPQKAVVRPCCTYNASTVPRHNHNQRTNIYVVKILCCQGTVSTNTHVPP